MPEYYDFYIVMREVPDSEVIGSKKLRPQYLTMMKDGSGPQYKDEFSSYAIIDAETVEEQERTAEAFAELYAGKVYRVTTMFVSMVTHTREDYKND